MNKHQIVNAHWKNNETGQVIFITRKGAIPQTFNYTRESGFNGYKGFIGKSELKKNWTRVEE